MTTSSLGTALVTGASSGIGAIYADRLAKRGYDLILVARSKDQLDTLATRLTSSTGRSVDVLQADLTAPADLAQVEAVLRDNANITMLVNNAGVGSVAPLLNANIAAMNDMITLNISALTSLTYAVAPAFVIRGKGTIVNISSVVGIAVEALNGVYGASKAYVLSFSQSLQHELADKGVRIQAVLPNVTATNFWDIAGYAYQNMPAETVMSADDLVDAALVGLDKGEVVTIPGLQDGEDWVNFEAGRRAISAKFSNSKPGARYTSAK